LMGGTDCNTGAQVIGFDNQWQLEFLLNHLHRQMRLIGIPETMLQEYIRQNWYATGRKQLFGGVFTHSDRGGTGSGAGIGSVNKLQYPLDAAIFTIRSMKGREEDIHLNSLRVFTGKQTFGRIHLNQFRTDICS